MRKSNYLNLLTFYTVVLLASYIPKSALNPLFLSWGINFNQLILGIEIQFVVQFILLAIIRKFSSRKAWIISMISGIFLILSIARFFSINQYYVYCVITGVIIYSFWIFYNIAHFKYTPEGRTGSSSALMFSIGPIISVIVPIFSGFLAQKNLDLVWAITIVVTLAALFLATKQDDFEVSYTLSQAFKSIEKVRIFILIEGIWETMVFAVIPVYTLFFIKTPAGYGTYLSYLAILSVIANFVLGHISDKKQKRAIFLYPLTLALSLTTFLFIYVNENLTIWLVLTGILSFVIPPFVTLSTSLFIDNQENLLLSFPGREMILALGRIIGIGFTFVMFVLGAQNLLYIVLGSVMLAFPAILFYRTKVSKKFSYL